MSYKGKKKEMSLMISFNDIDGYGDGLKSANTSKGKRDDKKCMAKIRRKRLKNSLVSDEAYTV